MIKTASTQVLYRERVLPKWTSFLPIALILPTFWLTLAPINSSFGFFLGLAVSMLVIWMLVANSPVLELTSEAISVGKAMLPLKFVGKAQMVAAGEAFAERGPRLDARAYVALQSSRPGLLKIEVADPDDPTPYWLFSSAKPEILLDSIKKAKKAKA